MAPSLRRRRKSGHNLASVVLALIFGGVCDVPKEAAAGLPKPVSITPNFTDFDCDFDPGERCLWTWDKDNYTSSGYSTDLPGQHGFHVMNGISVGRIHNATGRKRFFGPNYDSSNSDRGKSASDKHRHRGVIN